jgi:hypothetical protein
VSRRLPLLAAVPLLAVLTACGADPIPAPDVAEAAEDLLEEEVGVRPEITCPDAVEAEVGSETRCTLTAGDDPTEYGVTVTLASLEDEEPGWSVQVDDEPMD